MHFGGIKCDDALSLKTQRKLTVNVPDGVNGRTLSGSATLSVNAHPQNGVMSNDEGTFPRSASLSIVPAPDIVSCEMVLLHPELYEEQSAKRKMMSVDDETKDGDADPDGDGGWRPYAALTVLTTMKLDGSDRDEWHFVDQRLQSGDDVVRCARTKEMEVEIAIIRKTENTENIQSVVNGVDTLTMDAMKGSSKMEASPSPDPVGMSSAEQPVCG